MLSLVDIQKFFAERWELLAQLVVIFSGAGGLVVLLVKWRKTQRQHQRQRQIPSGDFPFEVIPSNSQAVLKQLMPTQGVNDTDPLADFNIPYLDRQQGKSVRRELNLAFDEQPWVIILGRTGLGKTREAAHLAELLNSEGWTVLKLKEQAGEWLDELRQFPTDEISPNDKLLFFLDDLNRWMYRGNPREIHKEAEDPIQPLRVPVQERLLRTLEFFERECRAEVRVIATARNETVTAKNDPTQTSELAKLQFERYPKFWQRFYRYELAQPEDDTIAQLLIDRVSVAQVQAKTADFDKMARRNDGTFRNIIENLRTARNRGIVLSAETLPDTLDRTWHKRYKDSVKRYPAAVHVYDAIALLRTLDLSLYPALVKATARLFISQKRLGWIWQAWQTRQALRYLVQVEQILSPRDGQIEARQKPVDLHRYADSVLILLSKLGRLYASEQLAEEFFDCGNALYSLGLTIAAIASFEKAIKINPDYQQAYYGCGNVLSTLGRNEEAIAKYEKAININCNDYYAWYNYGNTLSNLGRNEEALPSYEKAIKIHPNYYKAWNNCGLALSALVRIEDAIACYEKVITIKPNDYQAWVNRGLALYRIGRSEEAIISYGKAIEIKPDDHEAWWGRGIVLYDLGRIEEAIVNYKQAVAIKSDLYEVWQNCGNALSALGQKEEAITSYEKAIAIQPDYHEGWYNRGIALYDLGRNEAAIISYEKAVEINPDYHEAWYNKACCSALLGKPEEAIENLQRAIELHPHYREMAKTDADFDGIRQDARFQALVGE